MALTLPRAKTITVSAVDSKGTNQGTIDLTTKVGAMIPTLQIPGIIQMIRNTSVEPAQNIKENTRYVALTKAGSEVLVSSTDGQMGKFTKDPRTLVAEDIELMVAQFSPQMVGKKYQNIEWDEKTTTVGDVLAPKMGNFINQRRSDVSFEAIRQLRVAAQTTQAAIIASDAGATTFAKGAHVVKKDLTGATSTLQAEDAYNLFLDAIANFQRMGTQGAKSTFNQKYGHTNGINRPDLFVIMSPEFEGKILSKPGVFASESGNALFKQAGIKSILGVQTTSSITLDGDIHFMIVTTGMNGTYGYEDVDGGPKGNILMDPNWSFAKRLDLKDTFTRGVVLPFQVFVATKASAADATDPDAPTTKAAPAPRPPQTRKK